MVYTYECKTKLLGGAAMENVLTGNERNNSKEPGFFQKYKKEIIFAGVTVAAVVGGVLIAKNWDSIMGLAKNWNAPKKPVVLEKVVSSTSMKSEIIALPINIAQPIGEAIDVCKHTRNLPTGFKASAEKIETAVRNGFVLKEQQTWVDAYQKVCA